jgi:hypothetical protein
MDANQPLEVAVCAVITIVAVSSYIKCRMVMEQNLKCWQEDDAFAWNVSHWLWSPPLLVKMYDVTAEFPPIVPHRRLVKCQGQMKSRPSDSALPREFHERLEGMFRNITVSGRKISSRTDDPSPQQTLISDYARTGKWTLALAAADHFARRSASTLHDANSVVNSLLDAGRRHHAASLFVEKYAEVPLPAATAARVLRAFDGTDMPTAQKLLRHVQNKHLVADPELSSAMLELTSSTDWKAALRLFSTVGMSTTSCCGAFQALCRNVAQRHDGAEVVDTVLETLLDNIERKYPREYVPSLVTVLDYSTVLPRLRVAARGHDGQCWELALRAATLHPSVPAHVAVMNYLIRNQKDPALIVSLAASSTSLETVLKSMAKPLHAHGAWRTAASLAMLGITKRHCEAIPTLTHTVAVNGHWNLALKLCTQAFTIRRTPPTIQELGVCVHASVMAKRWAAALFWLERAHARGMRFKPALYDAAFSGTARAKWVSSLRAYAGMAQVGGTCSEVGMRALLTGQSEQRRADVALDVITSTDTIQWER